MNKKLKTSLREVNLNPSLSYMKSLILKKYYAKFAALKAKYTDLQFQMYKELSDVEIKYNEDIKKSIAKNNQRFK